MMSNNLPSSGAGESPSGLRRHEAQERLLLLAFLVDVLVIAGGLVGAFFLRFRSGLAAVGIPDESIIFGSYIGHMLLGGAALAFCLVNFRLYDARGLLSYRRVARTIVKASGLWFLAYTSLTVILKFDPPISRMFFVIAFGLILCGLLVWRRIFFGLVRRPGVRDQLRQRVVIVGWFDEAERLARIVRDDPYHAYEIVGVLPPPDGWAPETHPLPAWVPQLGDYSGLRRLLTSHRIDVVMVADASLPRDAMIQLANSCEKEMVDFKILPSCFQILLSGLHLESVTGVPMLGVTRLPLHSAFNAYAKRALDLVGGLVGVIASAPVIAIFAVLVYRESPGPVFYRQRRLGRSGKLFDIIKIRSMRLDAEADGTVGWSTADDPRRLRVGEFMRRWNIDELPQFWNVLKGEMSLVGPRPERPELILDFREEIPHYNARHTIKPGITGWAQINGLRGDTDLTERIKCDLYYMENWNLLLDLQIMVLTFVRRDNAC